MSGAQDGRVGVDASREGHPPRLGLRLQAAQGGAHEPADRRFEEVQRQHAGIEPRELEQVVDEPPEGRHLPLQLRHVVLRLDQAVLDRLEHRLHRGERVRRSWLAHATSCVRASKSSSTLAAISLKETASSASSDGPSSGARREVAAGDRRGGAANPVERAQDRAAHQQRRSEGGRRAAGRDEQDVEVVVGVEHDDTREQHRGEGERDGDEPEPGELQADRGQPAQGERGEQPCGERAERDDDRERDHGENR